MSNWNLVFDTQKKTLETLQHKLPEQQEAIMNALRLNRVGLTFTDLEVQNRFDFVEKLIIAITNGTYENFKTVVDCIIRSSDEQ